MLPPAAPFFAGFGRRHARRDLFYSHLATRWGWCSSRSCVRHRPPVRWVGGTTARGNGRCRTDTRLGRPCTKEAPRLGVTFMSSQHQGSSSMPRGRKPSCLTGISRSCVQGREAVLPFVSVTDASGNERRYFMSIYYFVLCLIPEEPYNFCNWAVARSSSVRPREVDVSLTQAIGVQHT